jgi:hypothetical protein
MRIGLELSKCLVLGACLASMGCGSSDSNANGSVGGANGVGGKSSVGGSTTQSSSTGGATGTFWPSAFSSTGTASTPYHTTTPAGSVPCMTCHSATSTVSTVKIVFGGTVYKADGTTGAPNVQVGVSDGTKKFFVYTASNGYYWQEGTDTVNWASADIRTRTANGESIKKSTDARNADCDSCHSATPTVSTTATVLKAP